MSNKENLANLFWAIGLFEGEGCIFLSRDCASGRCTIRMTDLDVVKRFATIMGWKEPYEVKVPGKPQFFTGIHNKKDVKTFLCKVLPYLGERRACKALDLLDHIDECYTISRRSRRPSFMLRQTLHIP